MERVENPNCLESGFPKFITNRLVTYSALNHHGTLFAGRGAEWFVESGFIAAASVTAPENVVCAKVHGMVFCRPVPKGSIVYCESSVVLTGRTSMVVYVKFTDNKSNAHIVDGFLSFVHVDLNGKPLPHGLHFEPKTPEEIELRKLAQAL